nr:hypothetical protein B0A51_12543 [Rachicladosporium sp. CCFEE 5018]
MKLAGFLVVSGAVLGQATYPYDIVQYWVDQASLFANGTVVNGLASPPSGWFNAVVQGTVYKAALDSSHGSLAFQQLAVSYAAHDSLVWTFHGTRLYPTIDAAFAAVFTPIGIPANSSENARARAIGEAAAIKVTAARSDDSINRYVPYARQPNSPGRYQARPGGPTIPDTPQAQYLRLFGGLGNVKRYRAPPPPAPSSPEFEGYLNQVYQQGRNDSSYRTVYDTDTAWYWTESSPIGWNRLANGIIGSSLATNVTASARFYAILNYALANAAIASWDTKYTYNSWRPITALRYNVSPYLYSNTTLTDYTWAPLLNPTPNHQDYLSTHATFGGAAGAVLTLWIGGDEGDVQHSSNVTAIGKVITRRITSLRQAVKDNGNSRIFGGIHFQYASDVGSETGWRVGEDTWKAFDAGWDRF